MKKFDFPILLVLLATTFIIGEIYGEQHHLFLPTEPIKEKVDTLFIRDTMTLYEPLFVEKKVVERQLVPVTDTLRLRDTLFVYLDREQVVWQDSLSLVYASGILPQVDSVRHFVESRVITKEIPVKSSSRWGLGVHAGMGAGKDGLTPYIGVGLSYSLMSW